MKMLGSVVFILMIQISGSLVRHEVLKARVRRAESCPFEGRLGVRFRADGPGEEFPNPRQPFMAYRLEPLIFPDRTLGCMEADEVWIHCGTRRARSAAC